MVTGNTLRVRTNIENCAGCALSRTRTRAVPWIGPVKGAARLVIVGEAPGYNEDRDGEPFVGKAGRLLDQMLAEVGVRRDQVFLMNVVSCRPPQNRDPHTDEIAACARHRASQVKLAGVTVGVTVGRVATEVMTGLSGGISAVRGTPVWRDGMLWMPTYHPAYLLRNPMKRETVVKDLRIAVEHADRRRPWPKMKATQIGVGEDDRQRKIAETLDKQGWVLLHSHRLGDRVLFVMDDDTKIPTEVADYPTYTMAELIELSLAGTRRSLPQAELDAVHTLKVMLGGEVVDRR